MLAMTQSYDDKVEECEALEMALDKVRSQMTECQKELLKLKDELASARQDPKILSENERLKRENQQMKKLLASIAR